VGCQYCEVPKTYVDPRAADLRLLSIQYLRGVAALFIVIYHIFIQFDRLGYDVQAPIFFGAGIDIFFVISGFIMWYTTFGREVGTVEFYRRRLIRIVPVYWLLTTFYLFILLTKPSWMYSAKFDLWHVVASYLFIPASNPAFPGIMWPLVILGWTLNYEMFFYFLFGLSLRLPAPVRAVAVIAILAAIVCLRLLWPDLPPVPRFYTSSIILEFALGIGFGYLLTSGVALSSRSSAFILFSGIFLLIAGDYTSSLYLPRVIVFGVPALLIVGGAVLYERSAHVPEVGFLRLLGDASYSLPIRSICRMRPFCPR
jgi:peptidoglycan/LPS O-acetylase OafA/YrhL